MSDFGELCPLFSTGVFKEVTFPDISMTNVTLCGNGFLGTETVSVAGYFTFGRTVVVSEAFIRRKKGGTVESENVIQLNHHNSETAVGTIFGTITISTTTDGADQLTWNRMTVTDKTFTSNDILGISPAVGTALSAGLYDLILRYKEK
jgi:hypothetical protein